MAKIENNTANGAYKAAKSDIANLLGWFECELGKEPKEIDWACIGSLVEVRSQLIQTLSFLSGVAEKQITESLEDLKETK